MARKGLTSLVEIYIDVAIGDNDDGIKQKSKLSWSSENDPLYEKASAGEIIMGDDNSLKNSSSTAFATSIKENLNNIELLPKYRITKIVAGQINNPSDLSGYFQVGWDKINIYLRFEVSDSKEGFFKEHNLMNDDCFVDKGWIEDQNGKKVWEMTLKHSLSAGGAQKNQYCDTLLKLKKGKYVVRYVSDESHSLGAWDAPKPIKQFWGISISPR